MSRVHVENLEMAALNFANHDTPNYRISDYLSAGYLLSEANREWSHRGLAALIFICSYCGLWWG